MIIGTYPKKNPDYVELLVSEFFAQSINYRGGVFEDATLPSGCDYESLLNSVVAKNGFLFKIVGIYETGKKFDFKSDNFDEANFYLYTVNSCALTAFDAIDFYIDSKETIKIDISASPSENAEPGIKPWILEGGEDCSINGNSFFLARKGIWSGISIPKDYFKMGYTYRLSFGFQMLSGTLPFFGAHTNTCSVSECYIDGISQSDKQDMVMFDGNWGLTDVGVLSDKKVHFVELILTYEYESSDMNVYIQPNRRHVEEILSIFYNFNLTELEEGDRSSVYGGEHVLELAESPLSFVKTDKHLATLALGAKTVFAEGFSPDSVLKENEIIIDYHLFFSLFSILDNMSFSDVTPDLLKDKTLKISSISDLIQFEDIEFKIVGVFDADATEKRFTTFGAMLISYKTFNSILQQNRIVSSCFASLSEDKKENAEKLSALTDAEITAYSYIYDELETFDTINVLLSDVVLWACLALLFFVVILIYNFISGSISRDMKEIGILRALGITGRGVAGIYLTECGFLAGFCSLFSTLASFVGCHLINLSVTKLTQTPLEVFGYGFVPAITTVAVCVTVIALSCFLPLFKLSKLPPTQILNRSNK